MPKSVTERTDRLVEVVDHCGDAKQMAEDMGEGLLAFLLAMVVEEARTAMRRATIGVPPPKVDKRAVRPKL